jgi:hypothetical protein
VSETSTTRRHHAHPGTSPGEMNVRSPRWFARNVRQVCDRVVGRPRRYRETVRSEMAMPSFSSSPWIRGAPQRQCSAAARRIRSRHGESIHGRPGRRERRRQHRRSPSRCQRSTVAGWTSTNASLHRRVMSHDRRRRTICRISQRRRGIRCDSTLPFSCPFGAPKSGKWQQAPAQSEGRRSPDSSSDGVRSGNVHSRMPTRKTVASWS